MGDLGALKTKALHGFRKADPGLGALEAESDSGLGEPSVGVPDHDQPDVGGSYAVAVPDWYIRS